MTRAAIEFRGGRLPAEPGRPHLKAARLFRDDLPEPPASADWVSPPTVPDALWGMLGNDQWGCCTCAGMAHKRIGDCYVNQDVKLKVTTAETLKAYSAITGFDPHAGPSGDNPTDRGALCQDVLDYWHKHGFLGEKIAAYAKVDLSNLTEVRQAINLFGQLYCGFNVPSTAMDQFNQHQPWDVVRGAKIEGGHCVTVGAYDESTFTCVTWGTTQKLTTRFWRKYFDEAWVIIGPDFLDPKSGRDHSGLDLAALEKDFTALTGRGLAG